MRRILVVCGAGASSTFLVHWMRTVAQSRGIDLVIEAAGREGLVEHLEGVSAVLVGAHLADVFDTVLAEAASAGVPATLLPSVSFDAAGAGMALEQLELLDSTYDTGSARG